MALPIYEKSDRGELVVFEDADWDFYESVLRHYGEAPSRISYDGATMDIPRGCASG